MHTGRHPVELLAEEFLARWRRGERPAIEDYALRHPELEGEIRDLFPAMLALEDLKSSDAPRHATASTLPPLSQLGDYRIVTAIGRGGMGVVYEAEQLTLGRRVALKVLPPESMLDPLRRERFEREAKTAANLHHSNIVPIFGSGTDAEGRAFYVMQLIHGVSLDRILASLRGEIRRDGEAAVAESDSITAATLEDVLARLAPRSMAASDAAPDITTDPQPAASSTFAPSPRYFENVADLGEQIARALAYAHAHGTLHRDIKPANLLLDGTGTAWVTDFGLAKALAQPDLTRAGDVVGTLRYLAPEQLDGRFEARSDVHALGLTLFELLTLRCARRGDERGELLARIANEPVTPVRRIAPHVPRDLATIVDKACAHAPRDRYASALALAEDLARFRADQPVHARRVSIAETAWRWCRRNRSTAALGALAILAFVAAGVVGWIGYANSERALTDARIRTGEAIAARSLATENLALSLEAFDVVFREICGPDEFAMAIATSTDGSEYVVPTTAPVGQAELALLQHLLEFYARFAERGQLDPSITWHTAIAHRRVGVIQQRLGQLESALASYERALQRLNVLDVGAAAGQHTLERAVLHNRIGDVLAAASRPIEAVEAHARALSLLVDDDPAHVFEIAKTHAALGTAMQLADREPPGRGPQNAQRPQRVGDARTHHTNALAILERLRASEPDNPEYLYLTAVVHRRLARPARGGAPGNRGADPDETNDLARTVGPAVEILDSLVAAHPSVARYRFELADALAGRTDNRRRGSNPSRARLDRAHVLLDDLTREYPGVALYLARLADVLHAVGLDDRASGAFGPAANALQRAVDIRLDLLGDATGGSHHLRGWHGALLDLRDLLRSAGRHAEARDLLKSALVDLEQLPTDTLPAPEVRRIQSVLEQLESGLQPARRPR